VPRGRPKGALNKSTKDIKALAQKHTPAALNTLVSIMGASESDAARVSAAKELLDRGYGKAAQPQTGEGGEGPVRLELLWQPSA
jgi:hypothetical protein